MQINNYLSDFLKAEEKNIIKVKLIIHNAISYYVFNLNLGKRCKK